jgi:hypothetical protein
MRLPIAHDFRGQPVPASHRAEFTLQRMAAEWRIAIDAPYFGDPAPPGPAGPTDRLWEYEVSELFIAAADEHYLEIELSPHGHHLVLQLAGVRQVVQKLLPLDYEVRIELAQSAPLSGEPCGRYHGLARIPHALLPTGAQRVNAYLIHGSEALRCYHAHAAVAARGGEPSDFHRLGSFVPLRFD